MEKKPGLLILAGGRSLRMGTDKVKLKIGEETFIEKIAGQLKDFDEKILSSNRDVTVDGFVTLADERELAGMGPAAGIVTALDFCRSGRLMTVPCDMPFVSGELAGKLREAARKTDKIVVARGAGGIQPLVGIYPKEAADFIRRELTGGNRKVIDIIEAFGFETVEADDRSMININTAEEYREILRTYGKGR